MGAASPRKQVPPKGKFEHRDIELAKDKVISDEIARLERDIAALTASAAARPTTAQIETERKRKLATRYTRMPSTILTGPLGLRSRPTIHHKTLLG